MKFRCDSNDLALIRIQYIDFGTEKITWFQEAKLLDYITPYFSSRKAQYGTPLSVSNHVSGTFVSNEGKYWYIDFIHRAVER